MENTTVSPSSIVILLGLKVNPLFETVTVVAKAKVLNSPRFRESKNVFID
jgi:hypothetical protein